MMAFWNFGRKAEQAKPAEAAEVKVLEKPDINKGYERLAKAGQAISSLVDRAKGLYGVSRDGVQAARKFGIELYQDGVDYAGEALSAGKQVAGEAWKTGVQATGSAIKEAGARTLLTPDYVAYGAKTAVKETAGLVQDAAAQTVEGVQYVAGEARDAFVNDKNQTLEDARALAGAVREGVSGAREGLAQFGQDVVSDVRLNIADAQVAYKHVSEATMGAAHAAGEKAREAGRGIAQTSREVATGFNMTVDEINDWGDRQVDGALSRLRFGREWCSKALNARSDRRNAEKELSLINKLERISQEVSDGDPESILKVIQARKASLQAKLQGGQAAEAAA